MTTLKSEALSFFSDHYKMAYGIRPMLTSYASMSIEELNNEIDEVSEVITDNEEREYLQEGIDLYVFEALVNKTIKLGANDEKTALKWIFDGYLAERNIIDVNFFDIEHFLYSHGIMHTEYGKRVLTIIKE